MSKLSGTTYIPIGVAVAALLLAVSVAFTVGATAQTVSELKSKQGAFDTIQLDIAVIKTKLENIEQKLDRR